MSTRLHPLDHALGLREDVPGEVHEVARGITHDRSRDPQDRVTIREGLARWRYLPVVRSLIRRHRAHSGYLSVHPFAHTQTIAPEAAA